MCVLPEVATPDRKVSSMIVQDFLSVLLATIRYVTRGTTNDFFAACCIMAVLLLPRWSWSRLVHVFLPERQCFELDEILRQMIFLPKIISTSGRYLGFGQTTRCCMLFTL
jgi:hypothetical protein